MQIGLRETKRRLRHLRVRKKLIGSSQRPRLCVHRSLKHFYAQIINDEDGQIMVGVSTLSKEIRKNVKSKGNKEAASQLGEFLAKLAQEKGIKKVCFDRGGYIYHGRVQAFAEGERKNGLEF